LHFAAIFDATTLRRLARRTKNSAQARRLLALGVIYDGGSRAQAAETGGVTRQIVRDWVVKFNADGPDGLIDRKIPGRPSKLEETHRDALRRIIESGPIPAVHGVVRWRLIDLCQWLFEEFRVVVSKQTLSRELRAMGFRKLSARPRHHAQRIEDIEAFKKIPRPTRRDCAGQWRGPVPDRDLVRRRGAHRPEEQDHPQLGQARIAPQCPARPAHRLHLHLRSHLPAAGQGRRSRPAVGGAIQHHHRPAATQMPGVDPVENVWQFMRDNWLSNRVFQSYDDLLDHCCDAWNKLVDQPWHIMTIGLRDWAHRF
jgi:transposase